MKRFFSYVLITAITFAASVINPESATAARPSQSKGEVVSGRVTDERGRGVADVVISDGFNIVKSNSKGEFRITTVERSRFVFMTTPDGFRQKGSFYVPLSVMQQKRGTKVDLLNVQFRVEKDSPGVLSFLHLGDTEARIHKDWVEVLKDYVAFNKPDFVLFNGDICYENGLKFHSRELTTEKLGVRAVYSLGNHDLVDGEYGEELYEKLFGPVWYSFNSKGVHFVNIPVIYGDRKPSYTADDIYSWMIKDLEAVKPGTPVVLIDHHFVGYADDFKLKGESVSVDLLKYNLKAYLYAHYHVNLFEKSEKTGVTTICSMSPNKGGIDHTPSSFRVISITREGDISSEIRLASLKNHAVAGWFMGQNKSVEVVANVYDTAYETESVTVVSESGEYPLERVSDWSWRGKIKGVSIDDKTGTSEKGLNLRVRFANGNIANSRVKAIDEEEHFPRRVEWVSSNGFNTFMTSPVITGELVITTTYDDNGRGGSAIIAVDKASGKVAWRRAINNSVKNNMALFDGVIFTCDVEGTLYAVNGLTGDIVWSKKLRERELHPTYNQGVTVHNGVVYAGHGHYLTALDAKSGDVIWKNTFWRGGVCTTSSPIVEPESGVLLTAAYWTGRFAHDAKTGDLLWQKRDDDTRIADNSPVHFKGKFYYASPDYIMEIDPKTGEEHLKHKINYTINNNSRPVVTDKLFVVGTTDKGVVAFDRENGYKELWNFKTNPGLIYTAPYTKDFQMTVESGALLLDNIIYFGANDGYLYSVDAKTGVFRWRINIGSPILGNIVNENNTLYFSDLGGNLWAIKI